MVRDLWNDLKAIGWLAIAVVSVVISVTVWNAGHDWYPHAHLKQTLWTVLPIVAVYAPLVALQLRPRWHRRSGLSRYTAPLVVQFSALGLAWLAMILSTYVRNRWHLASSSPADVVWIERIDAQALALFGQTWSVVLSGLLIGALAMTLPLLTSDLWPRLQVSVPATLLVAAGAFIVTATVTNALDALWVARLPVLAAAAVFAVSAENWLFARRSAGL